MDAGKESNPSEGLALAMLDKQKGGKINQDMQEGALIES